jgi:dipeptidyl aminopeptidase/acylaminoacyl peptidase
MPIESGMLAVLAAAFVLASTNASGELSLNDQVVAGDNAVSYQALEQTPRGDAVLAIESGEETRLVLVPVGGGDPTPIAGTTDADSGSISPDGRTIVFSTLDGLFVVPAAGGHAVQLVETPVGATDSLAEFSPDGKTIAFARDVVDDDGNEVVTLELVPATGGKPVDRATGLVGALAQGGRISFSPDGAQLVYAGAGDSPGIFVVASGGGAPRRLTSDLDFWPVFSADGATISFARDATSENADANAPDPVEPLDEDIYELWTVPAAGGDATFVHEGDYETLAGRQAAALAAPERVLVTVRKRGDRYTVKWTGSADAWKVTLVVGRRSVGAAFKGNVHAATFTLKRAKGKPVARVVAAG